MNIPKPIIIDDMLRQFTKENVPMEGNSDQRRLLFKHNLKAIKTAYRNLSKDQQKQFINEITNG